MAVYNRVNLHTQAGTGSLYNFFNASGRASSHFWVSKAGVIEQYVDTTLQAEADLDGNDATVSIETEGVDEPWTVAQIEAIVDLVDWICYTHKIPVKLAENAFINDDRSKGISWHRLGIDGNFPELPSRYAGRQQRGGGMHYSSSFGKTCPTNNRIDQIFDEVYPRLTGVAPTPPDSQPQPPAGGIDEDGYWGRATTTELQKIFGTPVDGEIWGQYKPNAQPAFTSGWVYNYPSPSGSPLIRAMQHLAGLEQDGVVGPVFIKELQRRMGTPIDGELWAESPCIKELQRRINTGEAPHSSS